MFAFSAQVFSQATIVMDYYANTTAYSQKCENKARPQMHCKGKCQMMKKLKEEEKKEQQTPGRKAEQKNEVLSSKSFYTHLPIEKTHISSRYSLFHLITLPTTIPGSIFHPPAFS